MTRFRSMTDEQILAKYGLDKEPMVDSEGHHSYDEFCEDRSLDDDLCRYDPRPECIPSPDPRPWLDPVTEGDTREVRWATVDSTGAQYYNFKPRPWGEFTPDPEFVRSEVNPLLAEFRNSHAYWKRSLADLARTWLSDYLPDFRNATPEQVVHARKVLTKLHNVLEVSK